MSLERRPESRARAVAESRSRAVASPPPACGGSRLSRAAGVEAPVEWGQAGWICFPMPEGGVDARPGEALVLRVRDTGKVIFGWRYRDATSPRGNAMMLNRPNLPADFAFHVHDATAEP